MGMLACTSGSALRNHNEIPIEEKYEEWKKARGICQGTAKEEEVEEEEGKTRIWRTKGKRWKGKVSQPGVIWSPGEGLRGWGLSGKSVPASRR